MNIRRLRKLVSAHIGQRIEIQRPEHSPVLFLIDSIKSDHFSTVSLQGLRSQVHFGTALSWTISDDGSLATKSSELNPQKQRLSIKFLMPKVVTIYDKQFQAIGRNKYPWDCTLKTQHPHAMHYYSPEGGWCTEFCGCFVNRDKTLDLYEEVNE